MSSKYDLNTGDLSPWIAVDRDGFQAGSVWAGDIAFRATPLYILPLVIDPAISEPRKLSKTYTANDAAEDLDSLERLLNKSSFYMAQSDAGSEALKAFPRYGIKLGYQYGFGVREPDCTIGAGYDIAANRILFEPGVDAVTLHLALLEQAGCAAVCHQLGIDDPVTMALRSGLIATRAAKALATASVVLHVEQCLAARDREPDRFVPPDLEETLNSIYPAAATAGREARHHLWAGRTDVFITMVADGYYEDSDQTAIHDRLLLERYHERYPQISVTECDDGQIIDARQHFTYMNDDTMTVETIQNILEVALPIEDERHVALSSRKPVQELHRALCSRIDHDDGYVYLDQALGRNTKPSLTISRGPPL